MSRKRYITTLISVDKRVRRLSDSAALLYTWMIPHAEEDATINSDPEEILPRVFPNRPGWSATKVARCAAEIAALDLFTEYEGRYFFPPVAFYRVQSNIHIDKRRTWHPEQKDLRSTQNSGEQRRTAENSASSSFSFSSSKHMSDKSDVFDSFWSLYPRKEGKGQARKAWVGAIKKVDASTIITNLERLLPDLKARERQYIKLPATWLNGECWTDEVEGDVKNAPSRVFSSAEEAEIESALALYRQERYAEAQDSCSADDLWLEVMRRGKR